MGWVSIGACTVMAGFAFYKFINRSTKQKDVYQEIGESTGKQHHEVGISTSLPESSETADITVTRPKETNPASLNQPTQSQDVVNNDKTFAQTNKVYEQSPIHQESSSSPPRLKPPSFGMMPAPPRPVNGSLRPPPSAAASLRVPQTKILPNTSMAPTTLGVPKKQSSKQVTLKPGHSPLDWAALTQNPRSRLRGKDAPDHLIKITPAQLKHQNGRKGKDAWTVYQGKVYNITPYLPFHPGGEGELMRGAGKDSAKLFMEVHPWVNWDGMLAECLVGILVSEEESRLQHSTSGGLDEMD